MVVGGVAFDIYLDRWCHAMGCDMGKHGGDLVILINRRKDRSRSWVRFPGQSLQDSNVDQCLFVT